MSIAARLPMMTLPELTRLHANAARLAEGPAGKSREQAAALLPLLDAEIAARRDGKKRVAEKPAREAGAGGEATAKTAPKEPRPRAPRAPRPVKTEAQKADDFLAGVNEALARR